MQRSLAILHASFCDRHNFLMLAIHIKILLEVLEAIMLHFLLQLGQQ